MTAEKSYEAAFVLCDVCKSRRPGRELEPAEGEAAGRLTRVIRCRDRKWCEGQKAKREREAHLGGGG